MCFIHYSALLSISEKTQDKFDITLHITLHMPLHLCYSASSTLREESSQTNIILQYKLLASILSAVCSVIQQS